MIQKVDPELLNKAFETISMVEDGTVAPIRSLAGSKVRVNSETYSFTNNPILRMVEATRIVFPDRNEGLAASMRLFSLFGVLHEPKLGPLIQVQRGQMLVHGSLVRAMAEADLDEEGKCDIDQLVELAKKHLKVYMGIGATG